MTPINDLQDFESQWTNLAQEIAKAIIHNLQIQELKAHLDRHDFLTDDERSQFIVIADKMKYDIIYERYGDKDSETYKKFRDFWQEWLKTKGVVSQNSPSRGDDLVEHFLYGSTPDPVRFLKEFKG